MSQNFDKILKEAKKGTTEDRVDALASIIEDMMQIVLTIPGIFDQIMNDFSKKLVSLNERVDDLQAAQEMALTQLDSSQKTSESPSSQERVEKEKSREEHKKEFKAITSNTRRDIINELKALFDKKAEIDKKTD